MTDPKQALAKEIVDEVKRVLGDLREALEVEMIDVVSLGFTEKRRVDLKINEKVSVSVALWVKS